MEPKLCGHCNEPTGPRRHYCILWGPVMRSKHPIRVRVCARCKKMLGKYC